MAITAQLFDGTTLEFPDNTDTSVIENTVRRITEEKQVKTDTGFTGAFGAGKERLKGDVAAVLGRTGLMDVEAAERYKAEKDILAEKMFKPTTAGWTESPWQKIKETAGGSLPYMAAPLAAGVAAATLPVSAPIAGAIGAGGAGLASLAQFTGSNLSRQMQEDPKLRLAETNLGAAGAAALPQAALDVVSMRMIPGIGKIFGAAGKPITPTIAKKIAEEGIAKTALSYGVSGAKLANIEGATEAGQQFFERLQAGLNLTDEQARSEYFDNYIGGAALGLGLSPAGTYIERSQTIAKGKELEKEEKQKEIVERQKAQREAYLAEQAQFKQTAEALGVPSGTTTDVTGRQVGIAALPAPKTKYEAPVQEDPLLNPLGSFSTKVMSPQEVAIINKRRKDIGKPRIGREFSIEDLADVFTPEEAKDQKGVLNRLIAQRTGYEDGDTFSPKILEVQARNRGIDTGTQGFKDFLKRTTGVDNLLGMAEPQRLAVKQALDKVPVGSDFRILESGSNARNYTESQYQDTVSGLTKEFKEVGNIANGRESVLKQIEKYSGLLKEEDQQRLLDRALKEGLIESGNETRNVNGVPTNIQTFKPSTEAQGLPGGMDIRKETFKQSEGPEGYQIRRGAQELDVADTAEEATQKAILAQDLNEKTITQLQQDITNSETAMLRRAAKLEEMKALGQGKTSAFFIAQGDAMAKDEKAKALIAEKQQQIESFTAPVSVNPFGNKAITEDKFTFYEQGKPVARFDSEEKADEFGISRLNDETLQQIVDSAPTQKQTGRVKRYADLAQKELNDRQSIEEERGIAISTTKGLKGATERLETLGIYTKETHDKLAQLRLSLLPALKRYGLENVGLRIVNSIQDGRADGQWVKQIMTIAMDSKDPMGTLKHESIHALKELGAFTKQEWQVLENKAKSDWIQKYLKDVKSADGVSLYDRYKAMGLNQVDIMEEAIAEAFKHFKVGNLQPGMIGNIWMRLNKMFEALRNGFAKLGFKTSDAIFSNIEEGGIKTLAVEPKDTEVKFAFKPTKAPEGIPQNIWNLKRKQDRMEKMANERIPSEPNAKGTYPRPQDLKREERLSFRRLNKAIEDYVGETFKNTNGAVEKMHVRLNEEVDKEDEIKYALNPEIRKIGQNLVGAPPNAKTEKDRTALVKRMTNLLEHPYSMYDKSKNWYERSGDTIAEIAHGNKDLMERIVRLTALYSQANSLGGNITAVIKSMHQLAKGDITARAGRFPEVTAKVIPEILAAKEFNTDLAGVDNKLMNFYHNLHDGTFKTDTFEDSSTIDRWMMRLFGYPHIEDEGEGGSASVTATQYKYTKDLIHKIADANEEKTGDKLLPRQIQAVLWTYIKNLTGAEKAKEEGKEFTPTSLDFSDYVIRATANITWESRPSTSIDLIQGIHEAPRKDQEAFNRAVRSIFETKDGTNKIFELLKEGVLYSSQNSIGAYENKIAPNVVTRVVLGKDDKSHLTEVANQTAAIIGYVTKQDAVPWYRADPTASGKMASKGYKVTPNTEITQDFEDKLFKHLNEAMPGVGFTRIDNSFDFINFRNEDGKPTFMPDKNYLVDLQGALQTFSSDVTFNIEPFKAESNYIFNDWKENPNGEGYLERFSARQLTDIQPTIDGWSKAYETVADEFGKEYGWSKGTTAEGEVGKLSLRDTKYAVALNSIAPETFLVPNEHLNDSGDLAQIPFNASIPKNPIRLPVGTHSNVDDTGYGANHILDRMLKDPSRKPKDSAQDLLESVAVHLMDLGKKFNRIYKVEGKYVLYDSLSNDLMFVKPKADHYEIATMYNDPNANRRYGNPVWSGRNVQPAEDTTRGFQTKVRGIAVVADNGRVVQKVVPTTVKKRRVITPNMVEQEALQGKMSLRSQVDPRILGRVEATTTQRVTKGYAERIVDAMSPTAMTRLRQAFINKYESIERLTHAVAGEFGADRLMAETSAIAAALQSDRAAGIAASSFRDGVPVFDKGYTYVSNLDGKVKGLIPILEPLSKYGDPTIYQLFQFYAGTRRGKRLDAEGREKTFTKDDIQDGEALAKQFPEFKQVFDDYQLYNQGLVKYMMDTGVISAEEAKIWTQNFDYIPFYRQLDGEKTAGPKVFSPIAGVAKPKKLKGSEAPLDDFMETIVRNARAAIEAGMKNEAARRVIRDVVEVGLGEQVQKGTIGTDIVTIKEGGDTKYYRVDDPLLVESLKGLNLPQLPFMDFLSAPANLLRNFVTKDPGFMLANLGRDSMQAWITSGTDMKPLIDSVKQFSKTLAGHSPEAYALAKAGLTGYDFAGDVKSTAAQVEKELRKRTGTRTAKEKALLPITAFWEMLEHGSHASDMATRAEVYKRTLERTNSEAEAFYQAMEVMNFSRKGNSAIIRILSAMIPFFNARVQGLDVLYRTGWGKAAMENKEQIQKAFIFRSSVLLGLSVMYWAAMSDDDEYKKLSKEERDNYWIIPAVEINGKPFRFPIPFELGVVFKVIPERVLEYSFGTDTGKDLRESLMRNALSTLSFNPIPQAVLPIVENTTNHSFFTGEPIIGKGVEGLAPKFQFTSGTSEVAKKIGREIDYSPQKIDNFIRGYTGTMGTYAMMLMDAALTGEGDSVKATKRMEQLPVIKRFFAGDSGTISAYYDLKEEVDTVVNTINTLQRTGNTDDLKDYLTENKKLYALKGYIGVLDKNMKQLNQASKMINSSKTMSGDEKQVALDRIHEAQLKLTERVRLLRKARE